ncbi:MAG: tetratricopeptide repeat protein [Tepidisphaerales bacterium]
MTFFGIPLPRKWWMPFFGIAALLVTGAVTVALVWTGGMVPEADKARLPVERGNATIEQLDHAIALNPDYREAYEQRARLRFDRGDVAGAAQDIEEALRLSPGNPRLLQLRAEIRSRLAPPPDPTTGAQPAQP